MIPILASVTATTRGMFPLVCRMIILERTVELLTY